MAFDGGIHDLETIIQIDTREQKCHHITDWFDYHGVKTIRSKMYVGDYQLLSNGALVIDKKYGLQEVYGDIVSQHQRFKNEMQRATDAGIRLVFLIEDENIKEVTDVFRWDNPRIKQWYTISQRQKKGQAMNYRLPSKPPMSSKDLMKAMLTMQGKYGCEWQFCRKQDTARRIYEILTGVELE